MPDPTPNLLTWIDLETTGLDESKDLILEVAVIITDDTPSLHEKIRTSWVVGYPDEALEDMDEWPREQHTKSGLLWEVKRSGHRLGDIQQMLVGFLRVNGAEGTVLAGSSVHFDRRFLATHMPDFHDKLHYRNIDVSSFKEILQRWRPDVELPEKKGEHRAMPDLEDSINLLRFMRQFFCWR